MEPWLSYKRTDIYLNMHRNGDLHFLNGGPPPSSIIKLETLNKYTQQMIWHTKPDVTVWGWDAHWGAQTHTHAFFRPTFFPVIVA